MRRMVTEQNRSLNLRKLCGMVWKKRRFIAAVTLLSALMTIVGTLLFVTPQYQSSAMFYVNNNVQPHGTGIFRITSGDLAASRKLVDSYIVILYSRETLEAILAYAGSERSWEECKAMLQAEAVQETEMFRVTVTGPDRRETKRLADAAAHILPRRIGGIIAGTSARVVEAAVEAPEPVSPSCWNNGFLGMLMGLALSLARILLGSIRNVPVCHLVPERKPWYS